MDTRTNMLYFNLFLWILYLGSVDCLYKRWKPNTNFENPNNWNIKRVPCGSDVVKFASGSGISPSVYVQTNTSLKELWLPMNGEMIFGANSMLSFTDKATNTPDCPDAQGEVEFMRNAKEWIDPDNWCTSHTALGDCIHTPMLDSEKIPGEYDDVIYPSQSSFFVALGTNMKFVMKSLKLFGTAWSTGNFKTFVESTDGIRTFPAPPAGTGSRSTVSITRAACKTPKAGCPTGNDQGKVLEEVCKLVEDRCDRARCSSPLTPLASCCQMCGALFNVTSDTGFNITEFKQLLQSQFLTGQTGVEMIVSRLGIQEDLVQVVVRDKSGDTSVKVANTIKQDMDKDLSNGGHKYAISGVSFAVSGSGSGPYGPAGHKGGQGSLSGGSITAIVIGVFIIIGVVGLLLYLRNENNRRNFKNTIDRGVSSVSRKIQTIRPNATGMEDGTQMVAMDTAFVNRMYNEPLDDLNIQDFNLSLSEQQPPTFDKTGFENPLYDNQGSSKLYNDPTRKNPDGAETSRTK